MRIRPQLVFSCLLTILSAGTQTATAKQLIDQVDPLIGTDTHGHTFPGATVPYGMVQVSPDTRREHEGLGDYIDLGYVPGQEKYKPHEGASKTLAYAYDDWCIAQVAKAVGNSELYQQLIDRSQNYRNVFDTETGYVRAKQKDGNWREPFDPLDTYRRRKDLHYDCP